MTAHRVLAHDTASAGAPYQPPAPGLTDRAMRYLRAYALMLRFQARSMRQELAVMIVVQVLTGAGTAVIYGFVLGNLRSGQVQFVATAAPVLALIPVGFVMVPNVIAQQRLEGTYDFVWSLPVPRTAAALSSFTVFTALALPGTVVSLAAAAARYHVDLQVSPLVVPAVLLTALMACSVGFGVGHAVSNPRVVGLLSNVLIFFVLMFSPIAFPIRQFPGWLAGLHRVLPFHHMAVVVRDSLTDGLVRGAFRSYLVLIAWTAGSWVAAAVAVSRRR